MKLSRLIQSWPLTSFFGLLGLLLALIWLSNWWRQPETDTGTETSPSKTVQVYQIGTAPRVSVQGKVEKSGVVQIVAQAGGIVAKVNVSAGQQVKKGTQLVSLSSNYQGGNAPGLQAQLAAAQMQNVYNTYPGQKELLDKQRDIANKTDTNADELREISDQSLQETRDLLRLNEDITSSLSNNLSAYESTNSAGMNDPLILQTRQFLSQFQSVVNQLRTAVRSTEYQSADDKPPADLSNLQREITLKQLDLQEKSLELNKEVTSLQYKLAQVNAGTMYPVAPFASTVQMIHVRIGQQVAPGTPLVTLSGSQQNLTVTAAVPDTLAQRISQLETSTIYVDKTKPLQLSPRFVSTEATNGNLYSIVYDLPATYLQKLADNSYIQIDLPIGYPETNGSFPFVPLDSIYQTQEQAYVFIYRDGQVESRPVVLGDVVGSYVQVSDGLSSNDEVILSRNVVAGESVTK